eukprot:CAMPEP_0169173844 /NCGR_PEP_ID=MMETSP1015-20121227/64144_1 /TAXON_ID=342587 /ORGANISM="Karlodinium micrum, Strain CCMP2283" /LENGTH=39 /DNA_ID= /DNA_START= /DNA_END= /DNA_ORIENTATION=
MAVAPGSPNVMRTAKPTASSYGPAPSPSTCIGPLTIGCM